MAAYSTVTISLDIYQGDGSVFNGVLSVRLTRNGDGGSGILVVPYDLRADIVNGHGSIKLIPNSQIAGDTCYLCSLTSEGGRAAGNFRAVVPDHDCAFQDIAVPDETSGLVLSHKDLKDRNVAAQHPIGAISGLQSAIAGFQTEYTLAGKYKDEADAAKIEAIKQAGHAAEYAAYVEKLLAAYETAAVDLTKLLKDCQTLRESVNEAIETVRTAAEGADASAERSSEAADRAEAAMVALEDTVAQLEAMRALADEVRVAFAEISEALSATENAAGLAQSAAEHASASAAASAEYAESVQRAAEMVTATEASTAHAVELVQTAVVDACECADEARIWSEKAEKFAVEAGKAQATADAALSAAEAAQATADEGLAAAETAQATADAATEAAAGAQSTADQGVEAAATAQNTADQGVEAAGAAQTTADEALTAAGKAQAAADAAQDTADTALATATQVQDTADQIQESLTELEQRVGNKAQLVLTAPISAGELVTVPQYTVGAGNLAVYVCGLRCGLGQVYREEGEEGETSASIAFLEEISAEYDVVAVVG